MPVEVTQPAGAASPSGSDTQVQFNDAGVFGGDAGLTYNKTTDVLTSGKFISTSTSASASSCDVQVRGAGGPGTGMFGQSDTILGFAAGGAHTMGMSGSYFELGASKILAWTSTGDPFTAAEDLGIARAAAGIAEINSGTAGTLRALLKIESVAAKSATPYSVLASESGRTFTNEGAAAQIVFNLPPAAVGLAYTFIVQDADGIQVVANTGDTVRIAASVSAAAGSATSTTIGSTVTFVAINATEWISVATNGVWVVA